MTLERTTDYQEIAHIIHDPDVFDAITDDGSAAQGTALAPPADPRIVYLRASWNGVDFGLFVFVPLSSVLYQGHVWLLPEARGQAFRLGRAAIAWMWANTAAARIRGEVPGWNWRAIRYAKQVGMRQIGVDWRAFRKNGKLHDLVLFGISRPEANHG